MRLLVAIGLLVAFFVPVFIALLSVLYDLFIRDHLPISELDSRKRSVVRRHSRDIDS